MIFIKSFRTVEKRKKDMEEKEREQKRKKHSVE